jgi:hypothetical protein
MFSRYYINSWKRHNTVKYYGREKLYTTQQLLMSVMATHVIYGDYQHSKLGYTGYQYNH